MGNSCKGCGGAAMEAQILAYATPARYALPAAGPAPRGAPRTHAGRPPGQPFGWIVILHGGGSWAHDEIVLWQAFAQQRQLGIVALQWWSGGRQQNTGYYARPEMRREIEGLMAAVGTPLRTRCCMVSHADRRTSTRWWRRTAETLELLDGERRQRKNTGPWSFPWSTATKADAYSVVVTFRMPAVWGAADVDFYNFREPSLVAPGCLWARSLNQWDGPIGPAQCARVAAEGSL